MLTWPSALCPTAGGFAPFVRSLSGGQSLSGFEQVQPQLHDRWTAAFTFPMSRDARILAMRALLTSLRGRANTIALPVFDRVPRPLSAATPGSPIGTTVVDPVFAGRWPNLAGTPYEFGIIAGITGSATIEELNRVRFTPTGAQPIVGQYVTLVSERRLITSITNDGTDRILLIKPTFDHSPGAISYSTISGITGTALIQGSQRVRFTPTGTEPAVGQYVTLASVRRRINSITVDGAFRILRIAPPFTVAASTSGTVAATVNANALINATSIDIHFSVGGPPLAGHRFSLGNRLYEIDTVNSLGAGVYRLGIWPWLRVASSSGATANFSAPVCEMRLAGDQEGADAMRSLSQLRFGDVTLRFDEVA